MEKRSFEVVSNQLIARNTWRMRLEGDARSIARPGQFVNIELPGFYLRRPISVCAWRDWELTIIYKVVGQGTEYMSGLGPGVRLDLLCGLGNGYDISKSGERPLLIGGGAGVPPMYALAEKLLEAGRQVTVIEGFNSADEVFYEREFRDLGAQVRITTADGSAGTRGFVTDAMEGDFTYVYACGPEPMLRAVYDRCDDGQFSFEERMGCGFGACMGCTCETKYGYKRICRDGPVLERGEIVWQTRE